MRLNQKGFSAVEILIVIVVITLVGFVGWRVYDSNQDNNSPDEVTVQQEENDKATPDSQASESFELSIPKDYESTSDGLTGYYFHKTLERTENPYSFNVIYYEATDEQLNKLTNEYEANPEQYFESLYDEVKAFLVANRNLKNVTYEITSRDIEGTDIDHVLTVSADWVNNIGRTENIITQFIIDNDANLLQIEVFIEPKSASAVENDVNSLLNNAGF